MSRLSGVLENNNNNNFVKKIINEWSYTYTYHGIFRFDASEAKRFAEKAASMKKLWVHHAKLQVGSCKNFLYTVLTNCLNQEVYDSNS